MCAVRCSCMRMPSASKFATGSPCIMLVFGADRWGFAGAACFAILQTVSTTFTLGLGAEKGWIFGIGEMRGLGQGEWVRQTRRACGWLVSGG